jgi:regulator of replication initiation timing
MQYLRSKILTSNKRRSKMVDIAELEEQIEIMYVQFNDVWKTVTEMLTEQQIKEIENKHKNELNALQQKGK